MAFNLELLEWKTRYEMSEIRLHICHQQMAVLRESLLEHQRVAWQREIECAILGAEKQVLASQVAVLEARVHELQGWVRTMEDFLDAAAPRFRPASESSGESVSGLHL